MSAQATTTSIAIIGGGPNATYALDILLRQLRSAPRVEPVKIRVFERTGEFGAGATHSVETPSTAYLNRVAGQILLGAGDFFHPDAVAELDGYHPTFLDWTNTKYAATGDEKYRAEPADWPLRSTFGESMADAFHLCVRELNKLPRVAAEQIVDDILDVRPGTSNRFTVLGAKHHYDDVDHILFVTGNTKRSSAPDSWQAELQAACTTSGVRFVENPFPLQTQLADVAVAGPIHIAGTATTAIDVITYLASGTATKGADQRVRPQIFPIGRSGYFSLSRPVNQKSIEQDNFHRGYIFNNTLIDALRTRSSQRRGHPTLDFELDILPLIITEMALVYYVTLFGPAFKDGVLPALKGEIQAFLSTDHTFGSPREAQSHFSRLVQGHGERILDAIRRPAPTSGSDTDLSQGDVEAFRRHYDQTVYGRDIGEGPAVELPEPLHGHLPDPRDNRFRWEDVVNPIDRTQIDSIATYRSRLLEFMRRDLARSRQGNVGNPLKAAIDGVWRDLRDVITYAVDMGGLTASSYATFLDRYLPLHNKLADGPGAHVLERIVDLIEEDVVRLDCIRGCEVQLNTAQNALVTQGDYSQTQVHCMILGSIDLHKQSYANNPLYQNMVASGLVEMWDRSRAAIHARIPVESEDGGRGLGLRLNEAFHPITAAGEENRSLTFLGPACEGYRFFQHTLARPDKLQPAIANLVRWVEGIFGSSTSIAQPRTTGS